MITHQSYTCHCLLGVGHEAFMLQREVSQFLTDGLDAVLEEWVLRMVELDKMLQQFDPFTRLYLIYSK